MAFNPVNFLTVGIQYALAGLPPPKEQFERGIWKASEVPSGLEVMVHTPKLGLFEIELKEAPQNGFYLAVNHYASPKAARLNLYENKNLSAAAPPAPGARRPSDYIKVRPMKKGEQITISIVEPGLGRVILDLFKDQSGNQVFKKLRLYNASGVLFSSYKP